MDIQTLLIVDDEPGMLESLALLFENEFNVITAADGEEGLSSFEKNRPVSLILLDLDMPVMNGVEALKGIRKVCNETPVLIMTGGRSYEWASSCADLGVQGYVDKPFDHEVLLHRIKKITMKEENFSQSFLDNVEKDGPFSRIVTSAINLVEKNFSDGINCEAIAARLKVSPYYLSRQFNEEFGVRLKSYLNERRIHESKKIMRERNNLKISDIASMVGMKDPNHFSRVFKESSGVAPKEYMKKTSIS